MKTELINKNTGEKHLCEKVTIYNHDYYVSDEEICKGDYFLSRDKSIIEKVDSVDYSLVDSEDSGQMTLNYKDGLRYLATMAKKVIATTNKSIDAPQVIDEVEELARKEFPNNGTLESGYLAGGFKIGYNKHAETHPISEDDNESLIEYIDNTGYTQVTNGFWKSFNDEKGKTTKELIQIWKDQQVKVLYFV